ncbi:PREDICTED: DLA class II histocompatibility antigen, DR-1 beta chain-like, partial [Nestor notabilis]|uniref:DLA class II histocompatibility antigen, DR-1 beta chain-like n=1 Tax=Nestor notabilis TaxID=176057 RepID=UPI000523C5EF
RGEGGRVTLTHHPAPTAIFQEACKSECYFLNGTERVRYIQRFIYNREQYVHFDSDVGHFVGDNPIGEFQAKHFNDNLEILEQKRAEVDTYCRHNYGVSTPFLVNRRVTPEVEIFPMQSSSAPQTNRL